MDSRQLNAADFLPQVHQLQLSPFQLRRFSPLPRRLPRQSDIREVPPQPIATYSSSVKLPKQRANPIRKSFLEQLQFRVEFVCAELRAKAGLLSLSLGSAFSLACGSSSFPRKGEGIVLEVHLMCSLLASQCFHLHGAGFPLPLLSLSQVVPLSNS